MFVLKICIYLPFDKKFREEQEVREVILIKTQKAVETRKEFECFFNLFKSTKIFFNIEYEKSRIGGRRAIHIVSTLLGLIHTGH